MLWRTICLKLLFCSFSGFGSIWHSESCAGIKRMASARVAAGVAAMAKRRRLPMKNVGTVKGMTDSNIAYIELIL